MDPSGQSGCSDFHYHLEIQPERLDTIHGLGLCGTSFEPRHASMMPGLLHISSPSPMDSEERVHSPNAPPRMSRRSSPMFGLPFDDLRLQHPQRSSSSSTKSSSPSSQSEHKRHPVLTSVSLTTSPNLSPRSRAMRNRSPFSCSPDSGQRQSRMRPRAQSVGNIAIQVVARPCLPLALAQSMKPRQGIRRYCLAVFSLLFAMSPYARTQSEVHCCAGDLSACLFPTPLPLLSFPCATAGWGGQCNTALLSSFCHLSPAQTYDAGRRQCEYTFLFCSSLRLSYFTLARAFLWKP